MTSPKTTLDQLRADIDAGRATMADVDRYIADVERANIIAEAKATRERARTRDAESKLRGVSRIGRALSS